MFTGFILSESLHNPLILNDFKKIDVIVEHHPEYKGELKIWHDFKVQVEDEEISHVCAIVSKQMKEERYAHFRDKDTVYVVLPNEVFSMPREEGNYSSKEYLKFKESALTHGIKEQYIESFLIEDE